MGEKTETVNHPKHYNHVPGIECKDVIGWFPGHIACAIKYLWRCGHKIGTSDIEDLKKAIKFIEFEIERRESVLLDKEKTV